MMKVYVVTSGSYSDYNICAIFSSHEKAVEYMGGYPDEFNHIEEYEIDSEPPCVIGKCWSVALMLDGSKYRYGEGENIQSIPEEYRSGERGVGHTSAQSYNSHYQLTMPWFFGRSFVSKEHAMKLAVEQRQKALREHPEWFKGIKGVS